MPLQQTEIDKLLKLAYESKLPSWKTDYRSRVCKNLQVHTKGLLFSKIDTLFPHEHPDSKRHCVDSYEPITQGSIWKAINNIIRIFSNSSFSVSASDSTLAFINDTNFAAQNLFSFFLDQWTQHVIATDPNSMCAVYPPEYLTDAVAESYGSAEMVRFVRSEHIKYVGKDMVCFISEDESEKEYFVQDTIVKREVYFDPNIKTLNGCSVVEKTYNEQLVCKINKAVYHVFTKDFFIRFTPVTDKDLQWDIYYFKKPLDTIPAFYLTGVKKHRDINVSFVDNFLPFGNLALLQHRNHRAVDLMFSYPRMSEIQTPCDNQICNEGQIPLIDDPTKTTQCSRCRGSGFITIQSPYKVYQKRIDTGLSDPESIKQLLAAEPVSFHTPDTGILDYSKDSWKNYLSMAEEAVFIQQKQQTGNVESAKKAEIDKEGEYSWIQNISKALNGDLSKVIQCIESYINANPAQVALEQPISFAVVTETEAFESLNVIISSQAPPFIKAQQIENFINKFVSKSSPIVKALKVLKLVDPLWCYSNFDLQSFKSNNIVTAEAWAVHVYAFTTLMGLYETDKNLFDKPEETIVKMVIAAVPKPAPVIDLKTNLLNIAK